MLVCSGRVCLKGARFVFVALIAKGVDIELVVALVHLSMPAFEIVQRARFLFLFFIVQGT